MRRSARLCLSCVRVGVGGGEIDPLQIERDHIVHCIAATAANSDHGDSGNEIDVRLLRGCGVLGHSLSFPSRFRKSTAVVGLPSERHRRHPEVSGATGTQLLPPDPRPQGAEATLGKDARLRGCLRHASRDQQVVELTHHRWMRCAASAEAWQPIRAAPPGCEGPFCLTPSRPGSGPRGSRRSALRHSGIPERSDDAGQQASLSRSALACQRSPALAVALRPGFRVRAARRLGRTPGRPRGLRRTPLEALPCFRDLRRGSLPARLGLRQFRLLSLSFDFVADASVSCRRDVGARLSGIASNASKKA